MADYEEPASVERRKDGPAGYEPARSGTAPDETGLTPQERRLVAEHRRKEKERREREHERAKERSPRHMHLDLSEDLKQRLEKMAAQEGVSVSSLVTYLLYEGLTSVERGALDLGRAKRLAGGGRYKFMMVHPRDQRRREMTSNEAGEATGWGQEGTRGPSREQRGGNAGENGTAGNGWGTTWGTT